jgi:hypothetical protein
MESKIRDWLASNLDFIEKGLKLIKTEFYVPDYIGSSGFIDLLCTDIYNNYVIIEVKRSDKSARQTINEILKYHSLLKQNYKARESEIRIIIVSTDWNELIRPYSEIFQRTTIAIKGYLIEIDSNSTPNSIVFVDPLSNQILSRKFAYWQGLYLFKRIEKRDAFLNVLLKRLSSVGIEDFVILNLKAPIENKKIITPFALVAAFQRQSPDNLLTTIKSLSPSDIFDLTPKEDFSDDLSYQKHLEDAFIGALNVNQFDDDAEAGYSEKLDSILHVQGWSIQQIYRYGIFEKDPRYNNSLLIKELTGHDGTSQNKFVGFAESTQKERINEIQTECLNSLSHSPQWCEFINNLFDQLDKSKNKFRILIDIYNPDSIVTAFYFTLIKANPLYLPKYLIFIDYVDLSKTEIFIGDIYWNQKNPTHKLFTSDNRDQIVDEVFRIHIDPNNLINSIKMALVYANKKIVIEQNEEIFNKFVHFDNELSLDNTQYKTIEEYIFKNQGIIKRFIYNYSSVAAPL